MSDRVVSLFRCFTFEAAHHLPNVPVGHKCRTVHGHSYRVELHLTGAVDAKAGWLCDFGDIDYYGRLIVASLDHRDLNTIEGLANPTCEVLAQWIWNEAVKGLPNLVEVVVQETERGGVRYRGGSVQNDSRPPSRSLTPPLPPAKAVLLLSGGQDSATALFWAQAANYSVVALGIRYGQRHERELNAAFDIAALAHVTMHTLDDSLLRDLKDSALMLPVGDILPTGGYVDNGAPNGLPTSYVPLRNILLLTAAAAFAVARGIKNIIIGVSQDDYSGYPDCRDEFIRATETAINLALPSAHQVRIITPWMHSTKCDIVQAAVSLGGTCLEAVARSVSCYSGQPTPCRTCPACVLRAKGFSEAGIVDPADVHV